MGKNLGLSKGCFESCLCPTQTRSNSIKWQIKGPIVDQDGYQIGSSWALYESSQFQLESRRRQSSYLVEDFNFPPHLVEDHK